MTHGARRVPSLLLVLSAPAAHAAARLDLMGSDPVVHFNRASLRASCAADEVKAVDYLNVTRFSISTGQLWDTLSTHYQVAARLRNVPPHCINARIDEPCASDDPLRPSNFYCQWRGAGGLETIGPINARAVQFRRDSVSQGFQVFVDCDIPEPSRLYAITSYGFDGATVSASLAVLHGSTVLADGPTRELAFEGMTGGDTVYFAGLPAPPPSPPPPSPSPPPPPPHVHTPHSHAPHSHSPHGHSPHGHRPSGCHPGTTLVFDANWNEVQIETLKIGDQIMGPKGATTVIAWIHRDPLQEPDFVYATTTIGRVTLTPQHMLLVNGELKTSSIIQVGDVLTAADGTDARVETVQRGPGQGAYHIFVDAPSYYAHNNAAGSPRSSAMEVSNMMLWESWGLEAFEWLYERAKACHAKGNPFNFPPEMWHDKPTSKEAINLIKEEAFAC